MLRYISAALIFTFGLFAFSMAIGYGSGYSALSGAAIFAFSFIASASLLRGKNSQKKFMKARGKIPKANAAMERAMRDHFLQSEVLQLSEQVTLRCPQSGYTAIKDLEVYYQNENICEFGEFHQFFPETYADLTQVLKNTILVTIPRTVQPKEEAPPVQTGEVNALHFIALIDSLNVSITQSDITNGLYEITSMLRYINQIEEKYPDSKEQLSKLYSFYLPILTDILSNYSKLKSSHSTHDEVMRIETKLIKTIILVNEALKTISASLCEDEMLHLNADISVLETILKTDGLVKEGTLSVERRD